MPQRISLARKAELCFAFGSLSLPLSCGLGSAGVASAVGGGSSGGGAPTTPVALLANDQIVSSSDERRGLAVPFTVTDPNDDEVAFVVQWRREEESFAESRFDLPQTSTDLQELLADPEAARAKRVCTQVPRVFRGAVGSPVSGGGSTTQVRIPETLSSALGLRVHGIVGRTIDIERRGVIASVLAWSPSSLTGPVGVRPMADGTSALVLDRPSGWRLQRVSIASGQSVLVASGTGTPTALAVDAHERAAFVASLTGTTSRVDRVDLASGATTSAPAVSSALGGIRGLAALHQNGVLLTAGDEVRRVDFRSDAVSHVPVVAGLGSPWGIAMDTTRLEVAFVAEKDFDRIVAVDLARRHAEPVAAVPATGVGVALPSPSAIAWDADTSRLFVVTGGGAEAVRLRALHLRNTLDVVPTGVPGGADPIAEVLESLAGQSLPADARIALGPDGLRMMCLPGSDSLAAGGGIAESRAIVAYDPTTQTATVGMPFTSIPVPGDPWRIRTSLDRASASATGVRNLFVWNSTEAAGGGRIYLRVTPYDAVRGQASESASAKTVLSTYDVQPTSVLLPSAASPLGLAVQDVDWDGDLDVATANKQGSTITILRQTASEPEIECGQSVNSSEFVLTNQLGAGPDSFPNGSCTLLEQALRAQSVAFGDLDNDGTIDVASANTWQVEPCVDSPPCGPPHTQACSDEIGGRVTVFFQSGLPGASIFPDCASKVLGSNETTPGPIGISLGDLDGDADLDIVCANFSEANEPAGNLGVFRNDGGRFTLVASLPTGSPTCLEETPLSIAIGDLNCDGRLDLAAAVRAGRYIAVFYHSAGEGIGFEPRVELPVFKQTSDVGPGAGTAHPDMVRIADFDADGRPDLASVNTNPSPQSIDVLFQVSGAPCGTFAPADPAATKVLGDASTLAPRWVTTADLDADGDLDLVTANFFSSNQTLFYQTAPRIFERDASGLLGDLSFGEQPYFVTTADMGGDGAADLVVAFATSSSSIANNVGVFHASRPGCFAPPAISSLGNASTTFRPRALAVGDLDGDGSLDIVTANRGEVSEPTKSFPGSISPGSVALYRQNGVRTFTLAPAGVLGLAGTEPSAVPAASAVAVADFDRDGDLDIACASPGFTAIETTPWGDTISLFLQAADGSFPAQPSVRLGSHAETLNPRALAVGDYDDDGRIDLAFGGDSGSGIYCGPDGDWVDRNAPDVVLTGGAEALVTCDANGDGRLDLATAGANGIAVYLQPELGFSGTVDPTEEISLPGLGRSIRAGDLDRNGSVDLVVAAADDKLYVVHQAVNGFAAPQALGCATVTKRPWCVELADVDSDGDLDILSANNGPDDAVGTNHPLSNVTLFVQVAQHQYVHRPTLDVLGGPGVTNRPRALVAADLDGDGEADVATSNFIGNDLSVFWGGR